MSENDQDIIKIDQEIQEQDQQRGTIVYILTNEAMPGLIKIGMTKDLKKRLRSLDLTGVPLPFEVYHARRLLDSEETAHVEKTLHQIFAKDRVRLRREFFRIDPLTARLALSLTQGEDITPKDEEFEDPQDAASVEKETVRRNERFTFQNAKIQPGSKLVSTLDSKYTAIVKNERWIYFENDETSISDAAKTIGTRLGYGWKSYQGPKYWSYEGQTLLERFERIKDQGEV